jgi:hypothetical protein
MKRQTLAWRRRRAFGRAVALTWERFHSIELGRVLAAHDRAVLVRRLFNSIELGLVPDTKVQTLTILDAHARTEQAARICEDMAKDDALFLCERNILIKAARRIREES